MIIEILQNHASSGGTNNYDVNSEYNRNQLQGQPDDLPA